MEIGLDLNFDIGDSLNLSLPMDDAESVSIDEAPSTTTTTSETAPQQANHTVELEAEISKVKSTREYNLRTTSIINRIETERRKKSPKVSKPKTKPAPLSKYRRRTANSRERGRMQEINDAFETLKLVIPDYPTTGGKLTKITTLRLAMNYIAALRELLGNDSEMQSESSHAGTSSDGCCSPCSSGGGEASVGDSVISDSSSEVEPFSLSLADLDSEGESLFL